VHSKAKIPTVATETPDGTAPHSPVFFVANSNTPHITNGTLTTADALGCLGVTC
jgi:hypothetical protein